MDTIEGSLDIVWENNTQATATPRYMLLFARYHDFRNAARAHKSIVGTEFLEAYLVEIGFTPTNAKDWIKQLSEGSVSIPNVMMPSDQMAEYDRVA